MGSVNRRGQQNAAFVTLMKPLFYDLLCLSHPGAYRFPDMANFVWMTNQTDCMLFPLHILLCVHGNGNDYECLRVTTKFLWVLTFDISANWSKKYNFVPANISYRYTMHYRFVNPVPLNFFAYKSQN